MSNERTGALLAAAWSAAVTASADPARFRRGREYVRENAITSLDVFPGRLVGRVQGSRAEAYEVVVSVPPLTVPGIASAAQLVPGVRELRYHCSCPDWDDPCKHAVAVALAFGERLRFAPDELTALRGTATGPVAVAPRPEPARPRSGHLQLVASRSQPEPVPLDPATVEFLGTASAVPTRLPILEPLSLVAPPVGSVDVAAVVNDAVSWLTVAFPVRS